MTLDGGTPGGTPAGEFRHEAIFYDDAADYSRRMTSFINQGLESNEPTLVMVPPDRIDVLKRDLGDDARRVMFADMTVIGRNPARIIPAWRSFAESYAASSPRLRGIGEPIWSGRTPEELIEAQRHEALLNLAFAGVPFSLVCPYDTGSLDEHVLGSATHTHPHTDGRDPAFDGVPSADSMFGGDLPPPARCESFRFGIESVRDLRSAAARHARAHALDRAAEENFSLAVHELAVNSILHGGGEGTLRLWATRDALVAEIADVGTIHEPMVGRIRPAGDDEGGRGVWLANQLTDLVQIRSGAHGTRIRVFVWFAPAPAAPLRAPRR